MPESITVQQGIFTSSDRGNMKGYQLVAKSAGLDRAAAAQLCRWTPSQMPSSDPSTWSINYFPVCEDLVAVTRTVLGGPEYSNRGGLQVVTLILVLDNDQFACYDNNAMSVAKTAMILGHLRLPLDIRNPNLPPVELPAQPTVELGDRRIENDQQARALEMLQDGQRIALIGTENPLDVMECLVSNLTIPTRRQASFTTGLEPKVRRPYQTHFLAEIDATTQASLQSQDILCVS